jgi:hypothetical protein
MYVHVAQVVTTSALLTKRVSLYNFYHAYRFSQTHPTFRVITLISITECDYKFHCGSLVSRHGATSGSA